MARIFLIRHGESLGNVDPTVYAKLHDFRVPLTPRGREQAEQAGTFLRTYFNERADIKNNLLRIFYSPFKRTVETKDHFIKTFGLEHIETAREDYLLREQDFGLFSDIPDEKTQKKKFPEEFKKYAATRKHSGKFYARPPMGESRADVAHRVRTFRETIMRDLDNGREDILIVAHGVTNRAFLMNFLHLDVEWFEKEPNPNNCEITMIEGNRKDGYKATRIYEGNPPLPENPPPAKKRPPNSPRHG